MRWLRGALVAAAVLAAACGNDKAAPVPSAHVDVAKRLCAALVNKKQHGPSERDFLPKELKGDWDNWHVNNDPDGVHIRRLNEYTQKSCGFTWDNPTTTTVPSTTAAP